MKALIHFLFKCLLGILSLGILVNAQEESQKIQAVLETTSGKITLDLFPQVAPKAVENFVTHINEGYYNGTIFHRVIRKFM
ncbi:peptidylprolyl isomerase, partial [Helicobacter rodentium]